MKSKAVLASLAVVVVLAAVQAQQQRTTGFLTAQDYAEIKQLSARYALGTDTGNGELFSGVFTTDGTLHLLAVGRTIVGQQQLAEVGSTPGRNRGPTNLSHVYTNVTIEPSSEGATGTVYALTADIGKNGSPSILKGGGIYQDVYVKGPEGWRIKHRTYRPAHSEGQSRGSESAR